MSLQTDLAAALAPVIVFLGAGFGDEGRLRRRPQGDNQERAADGSRISTLDRVPGVAEPIQFIPTARTAGRIAEDWGRDRTVEIEAIVADTIPVQEGDLVRVTSGAFAGKWVEAWRSQRLPAGGVNIWAFVDAGDAAVLDPLDVGF